MFKGRGGRYRGRSGGVHGPKEYHFSEVGCCYLKKRGGASNSKGREEREVNDGGGVLVSGPVRPRSTTRGAYGLVNLRGGMGTTGSRVGPFGTTAEEKEGRKGGGVVAIHTRLSGVRAHPV